MSHEFELHHLVSELVSLLRVSETTDVDAQVDLLNKNRTPHITNQVSGGVGNVRCEKRNYRAYAVARVCLHSECQIRSIQIVTKWRHI